MYGLLIYPQGDRAGIFFSYCFYRNKVVLLAQAHNPTRGDIHEPVVLVVVHVDVRHVTDEAAPGVEDAPLAEFALGGRGCWGKSSQVSFMGSPLASGGKGALLTALAYSVRSGAIRPSSCGRFSATSRGAEGGTHRPDAKCIDRSGATQREEALCTGLRGREVAANYFAHILLYHWSEEACTLQACILRENGRTACAK